MKYLFLVVIAISCIGCAGTMSGNRAEGGPFTIGSKGGSVNGVYMILSMRDNGLIVSRLQPNSNSLSLISSAEFFHNDSIRWIEHHSLNGLSFVGGVLGAVAGTVAGVIIGGSGNTGLDALKSSTYGGIFGLPFGMLIGAVALKPQSTFDISDPDDREKLIFLCKYCHSEPDELKKIQ